MTVAVISIVLAAPNFILFLHEFQYLISNKTIWWRDESSSDSANCSEIIRPATNYIVGPRQANAEAKRDN